MFTAVETELRQTAIIAQRRSCHLEPVQDMPVEVLPRPLRPRLLRELRRSNTPAFDTEMQ